MEKFNFNYSLKNIPIPGNNEYILKLIEITENFLKRLRWRALFYLNPDLKGDNINTYGFKSPKSPPAIPQLKPFEDDLLRMVEEVKFRTICSPFQRKLSEDKRRIDNMNNILVPADKTNNYYSITPTDYSKLMKDSVTTTCRKSNQLAERNINVAAKKTTDILQLSNRIQTLAPKTACITLKDHKPNFANNPTCRLINPSKSEIGRISKQILDRINNNVVKATSTIQRRNTNAVIEWFEKIKTTPNSSFITFGAVNFYPSITKDMMKKAVAFAKKHTSISTTEEKIIYPAKNTLCSIMTMNGVRVTQTTYST